MDCHLGFQVCLAVGLVFPWGLRFRRDDKERVRTDDTAPMCHESLGEEEILVGLLADGNFDGPEEGLVVESEEAGGCGF